MGLLGSLFSRHSVRQREPDGTPDDALNAVFVPLRNRVCDFKGATNMSWLLILPAIQRISIRLFIQVHGRESTQKLLQTLLESMVRKMKEEHSVSANVVRNISLFPELSSEQLPQLAKLNTLLWQIVDETNAAGLPVKQIAQGFSTFVALVASRNVDVFGENYIPQLIYASCRAFHSGAFDDDTLVEVRAIS